MARAHTYRTLIVGAGVTGIGAAIKLTQAGVKDDRDIVILERSNSIGGTWRDNYPGAAYDVPSPLYSFSLKNRSWSRTYAAADEVCQRIEQMADRFDVRRHIQFGHEVTGLSFDENAGVWTATSATTLGRKRFHARTVVLAFGPLGGSSFPDIRGLDTYAGHKIHSARWDHDYDFTGKRVAVIGAGASAIQLVPELVKQAKFVKVFQRSPGWVLPRWDVTMPPAAQRLFGKVPAVPQLVRKALFWVHQASATTLVWKPPLTALVTQLGKAHLRVQVKDRWLRRQLTPDLISGRRSVLVSSEYYPALQRDNCKFIDWPIATLSPAGIRTGDGVEHHLDAIVFATDDGMHLTGPSFPVTGLSGRSLAAERSSGAQVNQSVYAYGYPNLFFVTGPNYGPLLVEIEDQLDYAVHAIVTILDENLRYLDLCDAAQRHRNTRI